MELQVQEDIIVKIELSLDEAMDLYWYVREKRINASKPWDQLHGKSVDKLLFRLESVKQKYIKPAF